MHFDTSEHTLGHTPGEQAQADLHWAITSPDLMQPESLTTASDLNSISKSPTIHGLSDWLLNNDHRTALQSLIQQRQPHRLGIYYEVLWQYIFEHYPGFQLVAKNLLVTKDSRTLGEMDFIYFCQQRQQHIHLETAVKFYLGAPGSVLELDQQQTSEAAFSQCSQWVGPGCKDRLDIKFNRMIDKQTRLSSTVEGVNVLKNLGVTQPLREICLKGYFFYPLNGTLPPPQYSHQHHAHEYWLTLQELDLLEDKGNWCIMKKEQWLAPVLSPDNTVFYTLTNLKAAIEIRFSNNPFPVMIALMHTSKNGYKEAARYFITPNSWPDSL